MDRFDERRKKPTTTEFYAAIVMWICTIILFVFYLLTAYMNTRCARKAPGSRNSGDNPIWQIHRYVMESKEDA